ncbi:MAG: ECF transporter S component [Microbacteriaceae bacterium]
MTVFDRRWRTVDLVVAAVLGVAAGVVFTAWNAAYVPLSVGLGLLTPGLIAILDGVWLAGGLLVGLTIRLPGAALFGEFLAALVSAAIGNQWGVTVLLTGLAQGLAIEIGLALWRYRGSLWGSALTAGALGGIVQGLIELFFWYPDADSIFVAVYASSASVSGAVLGGLGSAAIVSALAKTGILTNFGR